MENKLLRAGICVAAGVAVAHAVRPNLAIDAVTLFALIVAVIPWLQPLFKSVELPGGPQN